MMLPLILIAFLAQPEAAPAAVMSPAADVSALGEEDGDHPKAFSYQADLDANSDVMDALARAKAEGKTAVIVLGANWCHDSIGLAGWLDTPRFKDMMQDRYVVTFVDV